MPSSKRNRVLTTSKTKKNHKDLVKRLHANIQSAAETYAYIWVFSLSNARNTFLKNVRNNFADSRIFMGKTKVMQVALGRNPETEIVPGVSALQKFMSGEVGLLFTNQEPEQVEEYFASYSELDFARSGATASEEFVVEQGELFNVEGEPLPMSIEPTLRKLGVPTKIVRGKVMLEEGAEEMGSYVVCRAGDMLESRQTSILKIFGVRMAEFRMELQAVYEKEKESVRVVGGMEVDS